MAKLARDHGDPALLAFIGQLLDDNSLNGEAKIVARKLLEKGVGVLAGDELVLLEQEVIEPYIGVCEACKAEPAWAEMLHVYDTGLCGACFDKLEGVEVPAVRPDWMPLSRPPVEDDTVAEGEAEPLAEAAPSPLGA